MTNLKYSKMIVKFNIQKRKYMETSNGSLATHLYLILHASKQFREYRMCKWLSYTKVPRTSLATLSEQTLFYNQNRIATMTIAIAVTVTVTKTVTVTVTVKWTKAVTKTKTVTIT